LQLSPSKQTTSNPILCVATQAHHPSSFALQPEPTTASQFPQLASNSNTLHNQNIFYHGSYCCPHHRRHCPWSQTHCSSSPRF